MRSLGKELIAAAPQATLPIINQERIGEFEISVPPLAEQRRIVVELDALQAEVDALKRLQAESRRGLHAPLDALLPALLDRAWTPSPPARSGCALPLRESRLASSQHARLKGEL